MLKGYLITAVAAFALGFSVATHWQWLMRKTDEANTKAANAAATAAAHEKTAELGGAINAIEGAALKGVRNAEAETGRLRSGLADGSVSLRIRAAAPQMPEAAPCACVADGAGAELSAEVHEDYLAVLEGLKRCPEKVKALQAILKEERGVGADD